MIVATFTVKAAREMRERLSKLLGDGTEKKLLLGTFHSIARRLLVSSCALFASIQEVELNWLSTGSLWSIDWPATQFRHCRQF